MSGPPDVAAVPVALLAGGRATRLGPLAAERPKALMEIAGRPFVEHQLLGLREAGIRRVVMCVGHLSASIEGAIGDGRSLGLDVRYSHDGERLLGTGGALKQALPLLGGRFFVVYGDSLTTVDYRALLDTLGDGPALGVMTVFANGGRWDASNAVFTDGRLVEYDKRRPHAGMGHIDYGVAVLRADALARIPAGMPYDLSDLYRELVAEGRLLGFEATERFYEIGSPAGLAETRRHLEKG